MSEPCPDFTLDELWENYLEVERRQNKAYDACTKKDAIIERLVKNLKAALGRKIEQGRASKENLDALDEAEKGVGK